MSRKTGSHRNTDSSDDKIAIPTEALHEMKTRDITVYINS